MSWPEAETRSGRVVVNGKAVTFKVTVDWALLAWQMAERLSRNESGKTSMLMGAIKAQETEGSFT